MALAWSCDSGSVLSTWYSSSSRAVLRADSGIGPMEVCLIRSRSVPAGNTGRKPRSLEGSGVSSCKVIVGAPSI